jgi:quercetin dioxygenase-like cupin family protein
MALPVHRALAAAAMLALCSCAAPPGTVTHRAHDATVAAKPAVPLVLAKEEGERRVRKFGLSAPTFILKVDPVNGGSRDLVMGYEDIPPGRFIPPHRHLMADEIVFVHKGQGAVEVGGLSREFGEGATIFIPRDVRVTIRNTGSGPLSIAFIFSAPGLEQYLREVSAPEGQTFEPLTDAELAAARKRHEWHTRYD